MCIVKPAQVKVGLLLLLSVLLAGCSVTPSTIIDKNVPQALANMPMPGAGPGSIYSVATYRPMFEGRRASLVGDILTITFIENTNVSTADANSSSKKGTAVSAFQNTQGDPLGLSYNMSNSVSLANTAAGNNAATFTGSVSVTVTEVKPNGFLAVSGEKQIALDAGVEFVRFSGVVNPSMITNDNSVASNTIADARMEYRTNSTLDLANIVKILNRFFLSFIPG
jgi:flagellar L-ring protein precursor FlgH